MSVTNIFVAILFYSSMKISTTRAYDYESFFFTQQVDHFGYQINDNFSQRYLMAKQFWTPGGPIFFYAGNEGDITMFANNTGLMWELAPKFKALLLFAEHRYYGISMPYGSKSYSSPQYTGYLTTEQALADFAVLIHHLKATIPQAKTSPVIAFGGSYGGMLAAWMRMKYPHIIHGALAASAPVAQFTGITPCNTFSNVVTRDFELEGLESPKSIRRSWKIMRTLAETEDGLKWLTSNFQLCSELSESDIDSLINWITDSWSYLAMTNYPYPTSFLNPIPANPIKAACKYLTDSSVPDKNLLLNIFQAVSVFQNFTGESICFNLSESGGISMGTEGWDYQSCTEMVMPMCNDGINDMFEPTPWNFTSFSEECFKKWNVKPEVDKAVIMYGGRNISAASNIIFSNGKLDPWYPGGILKPESKDIIALLIDGAAHHLDLRASNDADPLSVISARKMEEQIIAQWINRARNK